MCAQKLSFDYAHTLHTVRIVHNAHSVHRSRVQKGKSCDCINFVRATDPCCGSGGMFVQSMKFVEAHHGNKKKVSIYGQEYTNTTYKLCKMNLAIRGISANLGEMAANTFTNDQHKDLKADYIMANPPFNQKEWRGDNELIDDPRWDGYEVPPTSNANYGWILNMPSASGYQP